MFARIGTGAPPAQPFVCSVCSAEPKHGSGADKENVAVLLSATKALVEKASQRATSATPAASNMYTVNSQYRGASGEGLHNFRVLCEQRTGFLACVFLIGYQ